MPSKSFLQRFAWICAALVLGCLLMACWSERSEIIRLMLTATVLAAAGALATVIASDV